MAKFTYNVPLTYTPQFDNTYINKRVYSFKECEILPKNTKDDLWNANKCPTDGCYCQPYVQGDIISIQYNTKQFGPNVKVIIPELLDEETDTNIDDTDIMTTEQGYDDNGVLFVNIFLDTTNLTKCFYVRLNLFNCNPDETELNNCIESKMDYSTTEKEAAIECYTELCGPSATSYYITEPYCPASCSNTVLIEGLYPKYDCNGKYYGAFVYSDNNFTPKLRIYGNIEWYDHTTDETLLNRNRVKARGIDKYRLRSKKIPPYVVKQIANILDSQAIYVDGVEYKGGTKMSKDFDEGGSWIITVDLFIECDENNFTCN